MSVSGDLVVGKKHNAVVATIVCLSLALTVQAQTPAPAPRRRKRRPQHLSPASTEKTFSQGELDQLVAPIALYPDALLAQALMASTYPLDVVSAERWIKANPGLKDKALEDALQNQPWDPSVKSLCVFPQVLTMMSEKLDWTQKLGDAFLAQQADVMNTAQSLRQKAVAQGSLQDSEQQKVITTQENSTTVIKIEPTKPEVVYVPTYNPTVVYGAWPYPAYPPYYYYPPGYVAGGALLGFTAGVIVGGALWGNCNWGRGDVNVNVNRYNNFNRTNVSNGNWQHNSDRRGAVPYRDQNVARQNGRGQSADAASRDAFRGRADSGREQIQRGEVSARDVQGSRGGASSLWRRQSRLQRSRQFRDGHARRGCADARLQQSRYIEHEFGAQLGEHVALERRRRGAWRRWWRARRRWRRSRWRRTAMNDTLTSPEAKMHRQLDPAHAAWEWKALLLLLLAVALLFSTHAFAAEAPQKTFVTPDEAVNALVAAVKADDAKAIRAVLGNDPGDLSSGDAVADGTHAPAIRRFLRCEARPCADGGRDDAHHRQ